MVKIGERRVRNSSRYSAILAVAASLALSACTDNRYPAGVSVEGQGTATTPSEAPKKGDTLGLRWCDAVFVSAAGAVIKPIVSIRDKTLLPDDIRVQTDSIRHGQPQDPGRYQWYVKGKKVGPDQIGMHCTEERAVIDKVTFIQPSDTRLAYVRTGYTGDSVSQYPLALTSQNSPVLHQPAAPQKLGLEPVLATG